VTPLLAIENGGYVGAAYVVFLLLLLVYLAIMAGKLQRIQRDVSLLADLADRSQGQSADRSVGPIRGRSEEIEAVRQGDRG
jgi:hypothetical protein